MDTTPAESVCLPDGLGLALMVAVGGCRGAVLWAILSRAGPGRPARLNVADLARRTGFHRPHLSRAKRELIEAGMIREDAERRIEPVPDPAAWAPGTFVGSTGRPGASSALETPDPGSEAYQNRYDSGPKRTSFGSTNSGTLSGEPSQNRYASSGNPSQNRYASPPPSHREQQLQARSRTHGDAPARDPGADEGLGLYPADWASPYRDDPGPHEVPDDAARRFYAALWEAFRNRRLCLEWYRGRRAIPLETWERALDEIRGRGTGIRSIRYLVQVAADLPAPTATSDAFRAAQAAAASNATPGRPGPRSPAMPPFDPPVSDEYRQLCLAQGRRRPLTSEDEARILDDMEFVKSRLGAGQSLPFPIKVVS